MERTIKPKKEEKDGKILKWIKNGGGTFRLPSGKIVKPKEIFSARIEDIPINFRDNIIPVDEQNVPIPKRKAKVKNQEPPLTPLEVVEPEYVIQASVEEGLFNIVDGNGKPLNEAPLTEKEATDLIQTLTQ